MHALKYTFQRAVADHLPHELTAGQSQAVEVFFHHVMDGPPMGAMLLSGFAGTGKTTLVRALIAGLAVIDFRPILAAPTGRAAKVLQGNTGWRAFTLHRILYISVKIPGGGFKRIPRPAKAKNRVIFVDEASMIADLGKQRILEDLLQFTAKSQRCRLVLIGDKAQLPPVGQEESPALSAKQLKDRYGWDSVEVGLTEVLRQSGDSGVLDYATSLRMAITANSGFPAIPTLPDVIALRDPGDYHDAMESAFGPGQDDAVLITRSNARATEFNQQIRVRLLDLDGMIDAGDQVMVVENNARWVSQEQGFIANGDRFEVLSIRGIEQQYGLQFADATLRWLDFDEPDVEAKIVLDALIGNSPRLNEEKARLLHAAIREASMEVPKEDRAQFTREHPYGKALQLKFSYALTAHKSQGGQWAKVFVDCPRIEDWHDLEWLRWLYTAITRTSDKLYLIGFPSDAYEDA